MVAEDSAQLQPSPAPVASSSGGGSGVSGGSGGKFLCLLKAKQEPSEHPAKKRRTSGSQALEIPRKPSAHGRTCNIEWSMALGSFTFMAWSTIRLGSEQKFPTGDADGSFGPLLRTGRRLELRWAVEAKRSRARPGSVAAQAGAETGTIRFDACGQEVGRFPADANKTLVPLLARRLIDVEAVVGRDPPRALALGTDLPVVVRVSLRSVALRTPGQTDTKPATAAEVDGGKGKSKGQNQKAAADLDCFAHLIADAARAHESYPVRCTKKRLTKKFSAHPPACFWKSCMLRGSGCSNVDACCDVSCHDMNHKSRGATKQQKIF